MAKLFTTQKRCVIRTFLPPLGILTALLVFSAGNLYGQCGFLTGEGCPGTDYNNYGFASTNNFQTLEYDNYVSSFHSTIVRTYDGSFKVWGEGMDRTGNQSSGLTTAVTIGPSGTSAQNFDYGSNNKILKAAVGSNSVQTAQAVILTQNGLYAWGYEGSVLDADLTSSNTFQAISSGNNGTSIINGNNWDLPIGTGGMNTGVTPADVKMMFITGQTLAIVTCSGEAWVLSLNSTIRHGLTNSSGQTNANRTWVRVSTAANTPLQNVVALRGVRGIMYALTYDGSTQGLYTWGSNVYARNDGSTANELRATQNYAREQLKPTGVGTIKMIGATKGSNGTGHTNYTYYVLATDGKLYAIGDNNMNQLGDWTTGGSTTSWVRPKYPNAGGAAGADMDNIKWISPSEHDGQGWAAINVLDEDGQIWNWGTDVGIMLGRNPANNGNSYSTGSRVRPGKIYDGKNDDDGLRTPPGGGFNPAGGAAPGGVYTSVETGGHTTMATRQCEAKFGYTGHAVRGSAGHPTASETVYYDALVYNTEDTQVCGATTDAVVTIEGGVRSGNAYCSNMQPLTLVGSPAGGTFTLTENPGGVVLTGNVLTLNGATGTVKVRYDVNSGAPCNVPLSTVTEISVTTCSYNIVSGTVWSDLDNDALFESGDGENGLNPDSKLYANLVWIDEENGDRIVASVLVDTDGTYELPAIYGPGEYRVEITNKPFGANTPATSINNATDRTLPGSWTYTGTNVNNTNECTPPCATPYTIAGITVEDEDLDGYNFGILLPLVEISGNVWHDTNGDAETNGGEKPITGETGNTNSDASSDTDSDIWANLVDSDGKVVQSVRVGNDGTYEFPGVTPDKAYKVILTAEEKEEESSLGDGDAADIDGWLATGTNDPVNGKQGGNKSNVIDLGTVTSDLENVNFGLQQPPVATPHVKTGVPVGTPGEIPLIAGDDTDPDGTVPINPETIRLIPPTGVTPGNPQYDPEDPTRLIGFEVPGEGTWEVDDDGNVTFTPESGFTGNPTSIKYTVKDEAGAESNEATLTVTYVVTISGNVWHDVNGDAEKTGEKPISGDNGDSDSGNSSVTGSDIWANLVDENDEVVQSVQVGKDGKYEFEEVELGGYYKVILTTGEQEEGDPLSAGAAITGWVNTGTKDPVNNGGAADPTNKSNVIDLGTVSNNIINVDFGLQQPPVTDDSRYKITKPLSGATVPLNGTVPAIDPSGENVEQPVGYDPDKTDDAKPSIKITALPYVPPGQEGNAAPKLFYDNVEVVVDQVIPDFDPSKFSVQLDGTGYDEVSFDFIVIDAAGEESDEATYTLHWEGSLPVKWQTVDVTEEQGIAIVSWTTTEQLNVASFEVQNSSDARNWRKVGTVKAVSTPEAAYSYAHKLTGNNTQYFRIQSIDLDGSTSLSRLVSLKGRTQTGSVYPNPVVTGELVLDLPVSGSLKAKVYSTAGIEVLSTTLKSNVLNVRNLSSGHYILQVTGENGEIITRSFIVK